MTRKNTPKPVNFEKSLKQLQDLVDTLEKGELPLEESLEHFAQGIKLARECRQTLRSAEQRITLLSKDDDEWVEKDVDDGDLLEND